MGHEIEDMESEFIGEVTEGADSADAVDAVIDSGKKVPIPS